ncbi:hypothetical protein XELAEV_18030723mg [Xenopus laevis]|uniref:Uncharacterized protein n=1 Tax=Xenopus laevis TaxID=8355 RepID=A0A974HF03_XENLA|nr:hypothetical protein XELAEV_18030723mg [Xenopus laevis]
MIVFLWGKVYKLHNKVWYTFRGLGTPLILWKEQPTRTKGQLQMGNNQVDKFCAAQDIGLKERKEDVSPAVLIEVCQGKEH